MKLLGVSPRAQRELEYVFSLVPQSENLELIRMPTDGGARVSLLVSVRNGDSNLYYIADGAVLKQLKANGLIETAAFEEGMFVLSHVEPFQRTLLKSAQETFFVSDIAQVVPHYQKGNEIRTVYPVMPGLDHNYGLQEVSAELVDPKRGNVYGPYKPIPITQTGPLSLNELFGLPRLERP